MPLLSDTRICSPVNSCAGDFRGSVNDAARGEHPGQCVGPPRQSRFTYDQVHLAPTSQYHEGGVEGGVAAPDHKDPAAAVVVGPGDSIVNPGRLEAVEYGEPPGVVKQAARKDRLAAEVAALVGDDPFQRVLLDPRPCLRS